jgi:hypothetical protein
MQKTMGGHFLAPLPYVTSPGNIDKALQGIKSATVPAKVTQDFVKTILKIPGGSGDQMTSFLKKLGLVSADGSPSELYRQFRNPTSSGAAVAQCLRIAYAPLYMRNEYMHELSDAELTGLIVEETGLPHDTRVLSLTLSCIKHVKSLASFSNEKELLAAPVRNEIRPSIDQPHHISPSAPSKSIGLNLGYTINLNLPATSDPAVFDAIFKSLKEHLLRSDDA